MYCFLGRVDVGKFVSTQKPKNNRYEQYLRESLTLHDARREVREAKFNKLRSPMLINVDEQSPKVEKR